MLIERVVGRRMDPETGKIYHLTYNPPPAEVRAKAEAHTCAWLELLFLNTLNVLNPKTQP